MEEAAEEVLVEALGIDESNSLKNYPQLQRQLPNEQLHPTFVVDKQKGRPQKASCAPIAPKAHCKLYAIRILRTVVQTTKPQLAWVDP